MNLLEFKRRLMIEPDSRDPEFLAACERGGEYAAAAAESARFERTLKTALNVSVPSGLAEQIIRHQRMAGNSPRRIPQLWALAAGVFLAVAVGVFGLFRLYGPGEDLGAHLAWHWEFDGHAVMAMAEEPADPVAFEQVFSEFGLHVTPELMQRIRISKFCPTPDGRGAHFVLETGEGPVTVLYMPNTRIEGHAERFALAEGIEAWVFNVERGSMALLAEAGRDKAALADELRRNVSFPARLQT